MIWVGLTSTAMPVPVGWQASFFAWLQHIGRVMTGILSWLPNWTAALALLVLIGLLARCVLKQVGITPGREAETSDDREQLTGETIHTERMKEKISER